MDDRSGAGSGAAAAREGGVSGEVPSIALSVRQPWAWAVVHAGKDIENRSRFAITKGGLKQFRRIAVHAAIGMTQDEYENGRSFMARLGIICPRPDELVRGGIIGAVTITDVVKYSESPWFFGPCGLVLQDPVSFDPIACKGALGLFTWVRPPEHADQLAEALPWMISWPDRPSRREAVGNVQESLL